MRRGRVYPNGKVAARVGGSYASVAMRCWLLCAALVLVACSKQSSSGAAGSAKDSAAASASSAPARNSLGDPAAVRKQMLGCPVTVDGATTVITDLAGGVQLEVKGDSAAATEDIRKRAAHMAAMVAESRDPTAKGDAAAKRAALGPPSIGPKEGTPGQSGQCPIMWRDGALEVVEIPNGSRFTLHTALPSDAGWLQRQTRERYRKLFP